MDKRGKGIDGISIFSLSINKLEHKNTYIDDLYS